MRAPQALWRAVWSAAVISAAGPAALWSTVISTGVPTTVPLPKAVGLWLGWTLQQTGIEWGSWPFGIDAQSFVLEARQTSVMKMSFLNLFVINAYLYFLRFQGMKLEAIVVEEEMTRWKVESIPCNMIYYQILSSRQMSRNYHTVHDNIVIEKLHSWRTKCLMWWAMLFQVSMSFWLASRKSTIRNSRDRDC